MLDKDLIHKFNQFQEETGKYKDFKLEVVEFERVDIFNHVDISLIGSKKLEVHEKLEKINDIEGLPVYDASSNILTYVAKDKYPNCVFINKSPNNPDLSFANEGNSSAGTNFIFHVGEYFVNNHRTVIDFSKSSFLSKYVYYCIKNMKKQFGFQRGYIPSQTELSRLKINISIPKPYSNLYTSLKIQEIMVEAVEYFKAYNDKEIVKYDKGIKAINCLDKILLPSFFKKDDRLAFHFDCFCEAKGLDLTLRDIEFEEKRIHSNNKSELVCTKRMGFTPNKDNNGDINWLSVSDLTKNSNLMIEKPNTKEKTTMALIKEKVSEKSDKFAPIKKGDVLVSFKLTVGLVKIYNSDLPAYCNEAIDILTPFENEITSVFLAYNCMMEYSKYGEKTNNGVTLNDEHKKQIVIQVPKAYKTYSSLDIQNMIVSFIETYQGGHHRSRNLMKKVNGLYERHTQLIVKKTFQH